VVEAASEGQLAQDGRDLLQAQRHPAAVSQCLKHVIHLPTDVENQVPAVLDLIVGILIMKPAILFLFQVEREAQAGRIDPTLAS